MIKNPDFIYWHSKAIDAILDQDLHCEICGDSPAIDEIYIADISHEGACCLKCLISGKISSRVGNEASQREDSFKATQEQIKILNCHPSIFANHQQQWPVCCNDFMFYHGYPSMHDQIGSSFFNDRAKDGNGAQLFQDSFKSEYTNEEDANHFWAPDDDWDTVIFEVHVFECRKCKRIKIVYEPD